MFKLKLKLAVTRAITAPRIQVRNLFAAHAGASGAGAIRRRATLGFELIVLEKKELAVWKWDLCAGVHI